MLDSGRAARRTRRYRGASWLVVWLDLLHGVLDDSYLIANEFSARGYIVSIIVAGVLFGRRAEAETT